MEWYPKQITEQPDDDCNPDGTAVIDLAIHSRRFNSIIFVGGISHAVGNTFDGNDSIIKWIERETGLKYGQQLKIWKQDDLKIHFEGCFNGVAVSPSGFIDFELDENGNLVFFAANGPFPSADTFQQEEFALSLADVVPLARNQFKLFEFPSFEQEKWFPVYGLEEIYLTNNKSETIPFFADVRSSLKIDKILQWDSPSPEPFTRREINLNETIAT
ncbi:hypothetical protein [Bacillus sp. T33-2]|uniref:hypothetical protein n=1 Tax=Bacillus sp. T33-2 TaxID=2054168 RepID=UPI000C75A899|nr:hypothetical protein [Bacillus sp. T33-2]PLR94688.1 hypothetical protein CVD19_17155 [Bacillus sp. T33-2]